MELSSIEILVFFFTYTVPYIAAVQDWFTRSNDSVDGFLTPLSRGICQIELFYLSGRERGQEVFQTTEVFAVYVIAVECEDLVADMKLRRSIRSWAYAGNETLVSDHSIR